MAMEMDNHTRMWPPQPATCSHANYVTLLTGSRYAGPAACLPHQLRQVGALICPIVLVYNDADTSLPLPLLESIYGVNHMVPLSRLRERHARYRASLKPALPVHGRRLFTSSQEALNTHLKLWLWALDGMRHAVFIDIDILVQRSISDLLSVAPRKGAIASVTCKSKYGERFFNSGLLVFAPSLPELERLLEIERFSNFPWNGHIPHRDDAWPDICAPRDDPHAAERMPRFANSSNFLRDCRSAYGPGRQPGMMSKACESKLTDQSVLNHVYPKHLNLSRGYNDAKGFALETSHIVHFVGEKKPWDVSALRDKYASAGRRNATAVWQHRCSRFMLLANTRTSSVSTRV